MITYDYKCYECGLEKEVRHSIKEDPKIVCESCGAEMKRRPSTGHGAFVNKNDSYTQYHGEGKERKKGRKDWVKKNPYYGAKLPDHL